MAKIKQWLTRFMMCRYGADKLNMWILGAGVIITFVGMLLPGETTKMVLSLVADIFLIIALYRCFSRQTYKRYQENRKFLQLLDRVKDRNHRYFSCPKCHQVVRVPRKKGKIAITCPKCREKFVKKT